MSDEWAHDAAWKEVPTVNVTPVGYAVASSAAREVLAVAGTLEDAPAVNLAGR